MWPRVLGRADISNRPHSGVTHMSLRCHSGVTQVCTVPPSAGTATPAFSVCMSSMSLDGGHAGHGPGGSAAQCLSQGACHTHSYRWHLMTRLCL